MLRKSANANRVSTPSGSEVDHRATSLLIRSLSLPVLTPSAAHYSLLITFVFESLFNQSADPFRARVPRSFANRVLPRAH